MPECRDLRLASSSVRSGQIRYFDKQEEMIGLDHVLGSAAIPPSFPAVRINGEPYWDGGIYSNTPIEVVFDDNPREELRRLRGADLARARAGARIHRASLHAPERYPVRQPLQESHRAPGTASPHASHRARTRQSCSPKSRKSTPEVKELANWGCATANCISLEINAEPIDGETNARDYDFSRAAIQARWQAGYADTRRMIEQRPWNDPIDPIVGVSVYASDASP